MVCYKHNDTVLHMISVGVIESIERISCVVLSMKTSLQKHQSSTTINKYGAHGAALSQPHEIVGRFGWEETNGEAVAGAD